MPNLQKPLHDLSLATGSLSPQAVKLISGALTALAELDAKQKALMAVCRALDPHGALSRWALAQAIAARLQRFKAAALRRIQAGGRGVHDEVEAALLNLCDGCCSAGKIWEKLRDMDLPRPR